MQILPRYTHIVNKHLKHTYLSFDEEANLVIKSPKVSQRYIEQLLLKRSAWINRSREKILQKKENHLLNQSNEIAKREEILLPLDKELYKKEKDLNKREKEITKVEKKIKLKKYVKTNKTN